MDINKYKSSENFERNEAIYVLHNIDGTPIAEIALNFDLDLEETKGIITMHEKYENALET